MRALEEAEGRLTVAFNVLFLCTANSARSILFAAALNHVAGDRFRAYSAGSQPAGFVNPHALAELSRRGITTADARSKSWNEFSGDGAPTFDLVITVCDSAASESCPVLFGDFVKAHWGLPDPAAVQGDEAVIRTAFRRTADVVIARAEALAALPVEAFSVEQLQCALHEIELKHAAAPLTEVA
jgi:protein-tyrosine-phosphatase